MWIDVSSWTLQFCTCVLTKHIWQRPFWLSTHPSTAILAKQVTISSQGTGFYLSEDWMKHNVATKMKTAKLDVPACCGPTPQRVDLLIRLQPFCEHAVGFARTESALWPACYVAQRGVLSRGVTWYSSYHLRLPTSFSLTHTYTHIHTHTCAAFLSLNSALLFFHSFLPVK